MKRSKFTPKQIIGILEEYDSGRSGLEISRKYGISQATLYNWKKKYSGMELKDLKYLKSLESENAKLKRMYAELALDYQMAKEVISKKL